MPAEISAVLGLVKSKPAGRSDDGVPANSVRETRQVLPLSMARESAETATDNSSKNVDRIVDDLNNKVQNIRRELRFAIDDNSGYTIITVVDSETDEVIRQIPSEEVVALAQHFNEHSGLLMDAKA